MDRSTAIERLPEAYAAALRLHDEGHDDKAIAARLGLAPAAVGPLLRVAVAKLDAILAAREEGIWPSRGDTAPCIFEGPD